MDLILWQVIRASGLLAFALLSASVALGISVRTRAMDGLVKRGWVNEIHQSLSIAALAATAAHVLLLFGNQHVSFGVADVLVPMTSAWKPLAVAGGIFSFYLLVLLVLSSHLKQIIGHGAWRAIHYGGFAAWITATGHGIAAGSDSDLVFIQWMYLLSAAMVVFLLAFRVLTTPRKQPSHVPVRVEARLEQS